MCDSRLHRGVLMVDKCLTYLALTYLGTLSRRKSYSSVVVVLILCGSCVSLVGCSVVALRLLVGQCLITCWLRAIRLLSICFRSHSAFYWLLPGCLFVACLITSWLFYGCFPVTSYLLCVCFAVALLLFVGLLWLASALRLLLAFGLDGRTPWLLCGCFPLAVWFLLGCSFVDFKLLSRCDACAYWLLSACLLVACWSRCGCFPAACWLQHYLVTANFSMATTQLVTAKKGMPRLQNGHGMSGLQHVKVKELTGMLKLQQGSSWLQHSRHVTVTIQCFNKQEANEAATHKKPGRSCLSRTMIVISSAIEAPLTRVEHLHDIAQ